MMVLIASNEAAEIKPHRGKPRNVTIVEMQQKSIRQRRGPTIKFTGALIAKTEFVIRGGRDMRFEIWQTEGGALIPVSTTDEETRAAIVEPGEEGAMRRAAMDFFDWDSRAREMVKDQLKWRLHIHVA